MIRRRFVTPYNFAYLFKLFLPPHYDDVEMGLCHCGSDWYSANELGTLGYRKSQKHDPVDACPIWYLSTSALFFLAV